jgi:hypothetical protein
MTVYVGKKFKYDRCDVTVTHISAEHDTRCNMNVKKLIRTSMIALLVVAMSVSMAAAATIDIAPNPIHNALNGTHETTGTVTISNAVTGTRSMVLDTNTPNLQARLVGDDGFDTGWVTDLGATNTYTATTRDYTFTLTVRGTGAGRVAVADYLGTATPSLVQFSECDIAYETTDVKIPEFVTIAIPMIALLGLVLYMRRKKD